MALKRLRMLFGRRGPKARFRRVTIAKALIEIETVLGPNTCVKGDVRSSDGVRIDGELEGTIEIAGDLIVGENANVIATISAHNVQIQGSVKGDVAAKRLEILDTGKLWGDVMVRSLVLEDGGFFQGHSKMQDLVLDNQLVV